jgi:hypothetical protein
MITVHGWLFTLYEPRQKHGPCQSAKNPGFASDSDPLRGIGGRACMSREHRRDD